MFSNDLKLQYTNITVEPYGSLSVDKGVPSKEQYLGKMVVIKFIPDCGESSRLIYVPFWL